MKASLKFFFILVVFFIAIGCQSEQEKKEAFFNSADKYYAEKEYKKAEIELKNAIKIDPEYVQAYYLLAETMVKLGDLRGAFGQYSKVATLDPDNHEVQLKLAEFLFLGKQIEPALEKLVKFLEKEPLNIKALHLKAQIYLVKKNYNEAASVYNQILISDTINIGALQNLGKIKELENKPDEAEKLFLKAIKIDGQNIKLYSALSRLYIKQKAFKKAELLLQDAVAKNPGNEISHILLGGYYFRQKKNDQAEKAYQEAINTGNNTGKSYIVTADFYDRIQQPEKALEFYQKASALEPENLSITNTIARFHFNQKNFDTAHTLVDQILGKRPEFYPAQLLKTEILLLNKDFDAVLPLIESLEKNEPNSFKVHFLKGLYYVGQNKIALAKESILKSIELNPKFLKAKLLVSNLYLSEKSYAPARIQASDILKLDPGNYTARAIRANALIGLNKPDQA